MRCATVSSTTSAAPATPLPARRCSRPNPTAGASPPAPARAPLQQSVRVRRGRACGVTDRLSGVVTVGIQDADRGGHTRASETIRPSRSDCSAARHTATARRASSPETSARRSRNAGTTRRELLLQLEQLAGHRERESSRARRLRGAWPSARRRPRACGRDAPDHHAADGALGADDLCRQVVFEGGQRLSVTTA